MDTQETLHLIWIHDILVIHGLFEPLTYMELRERLQTDENFVNLLYAWDRIINI